MKTRHISEESFWKIFTEGELNPLLESVKHDDTLDLELRGDAVNIYYRGGSLFKISKRTNGYKIEFNTKYCINPSLILDGTPSAEVAVRNIPLYKQAMDWYFHAHPKYEREFQQVIVRENNNHGKISGGTDYYIADIEYADGDARFDMVALKWLSNVAVRKDKQKVSLALIEVKYGNGALKGAAGIEKHLDDFQKFLDNKDNLASFCRDMSEVFRQKCSLGLVDGLQEHQYEVEISPLNPEVIFVFANHDPDSGILSEILEKKDLTKYTFPILIANASSMGYCLYSDCLKRLNP